MASQDWFDKDFYKVLGVDKSVSAADLKKTYRKLARQYHPDSNPGDAKAEAKFKEISEAYSVLNDPEQREEYDQIRAMGSGARFSAPGAGAGGGFDDVFSRFGQGRQAPSGGFDDFFTMFDQQGGGFGSGRFGQTTGGFRGFGGPQKGADVSARTTLDFVTAAKGETITLAGEDNVPFKVKIPAGVSDGQKIRLRGRGRKSPDGGESGDIVVTVAVRPTRSSRATDSTCASPCRSPSPRPLSVRRSRFRRSAATPCACAWPPAPPRDACCASRVADLDHQGHRRPARRGPGRGAHASRRRRARGPRAVPRTGAERESPRRPHGQGAIDTRASPRFSASDTTGCREPGTRIRHDERGEDVSEREIDEDAPIFAIAAAAELSNMHPQTLRQYDRLGLVVPARTQGGSRRYSSRHVQQLREVARLSGEGMSLPAIARLLALEERVHELARRVNDLERQLTIERQSRPGAPRLRGRATGSVVTLRHGARVRRATDIVLWRPRDMHGD